MKFIDHRSIPVKGGSPPVRGRGLKCIAEVRTDEVRTGRPLCGGVG